MSEEEKHNTGKTGEKLERALLPITLVTTTLGLLLGVVESVTKIVSIVESHYYLFLTICLIASILVAWRWKPKRKRSLANGTRFTLCGIAVLSYGFAVWHTYGELHWNITRPATPPHEVDPPKLPSSIVPKPKGTPVEVNILNQQSIEPQQTPLPPSKLALESFDLNEDMSSFNQTQALLFAEPGPTYRTFAYDNTVSQAFFSGACAGPTGNRPIDAVIPILRKRLKNINKEDLLPYLESAKDLSHLRRERKEIFEQIIPTPTELERLQRESPEDYKSLHEWFLYCVGIQQPVLTFIVRNDGERSILLKSIVYHVLKVGGVRGGATGPVLPEITYNHVLKHEVGDQTWDLKPPLQVAGNDRVSFNVRLFAAENEPGLAWLLKMEIKASDGASAETDEFQIIMGK